LLAGLSVTTVARSEGFAARAQVELSAGGRSALATLYQVSSDIVAIDEVGLCETVWDRLSVEDGAQLDIRHPQPLDSMSFVRLKAYGHRLDAPRLRTIIKDVATERYSDVQLAAFITAFSSQPAQLAEMVALTGAMVDAGGLLSWPHPIVVDKHCVGGLPANRTTPLIVAIVAVAGLAIPKTTSRAITSPAGTAEAMETMAPVDLDIPAMRRLVEQEGGCIIWGGSQFALRVLRPGGTLPSLCVYSSDLIIPVDAFHAGLGDKIVTSLCPGGKEPMRRLMSVIASGCIDLAAMVTHRFSLDRIEEAYELFSNQRDGVLKVAISP